MLYAAWNREVSLHSHILCGDIEYIFLFFPFFFPKNWEFNIIQWNNCSGGNILQAPKVKEKGSVMKNTRLS